VIALTRRLSDARHSASPGKNWKNPHGEWVRTFVILTTPANEWAGTIHDRMPAILAPAAYDRWLSTDPDRAKRPPVERARAQRKSCKKSRVLS
jgi:putative SOS response-associated peptidase YedK